MPRREPTADELADLPLLNTEQMTLKHGVSDSVVRRWRKEHKAPNPATVYADPEPVAHEDHSGVWKIPESANFDDGMWTALESVQRELAALSNERFEVEVALPGDQPSLVIFQSDLHIGHTSTDMSKLRLDLETIRNTPGMYVILGGDLTDNVVTSVTSRGMHHEQLTPTRVQKHLIDEAVKFLGREKVLAMVLGNHDAWSISNDDYDPISYLANKLGCPYLGPFGFLTLRLGTETYRVLAAHQFRMRSSFNATHQAKRLEDFQGEADVVFTGHTHESAAESTWRRHQRKFYGQAGSYLRNSRYSKSLGFGQVTMEMPGAILFPDRHKVIGVHDGIGDGPTLLRAWRSE
jgi:predicted MPP superfamily phosphohydrolase